MSTPSESHPLLTELAHLFAAVPSTQLRRNVEELYHAYLAEPETVLPSKEIAMSMYFLIRFLNEMEDQNELTVNNR